MKYRILKEELYASNFEEIYTKLRKELTQNVLHLTQNEVVNALSKTTESAILAGYLVTLAKKELRTAEKELDIEYSKWCLEAYKSLEDKLREGLYVSTISKDIVKGWVYKLHGIKYNELKERVNDIKLIVEALEFFSSQYQKRQENIQTQTRYLTKDIK